MALKFQAKKILYVMIDILSICAAFFLAFYFRYGQTVFRKIDLAFIESVVLAVPIFILCYIGFRFYSTIWIHAGLREILNAVAANTFAGFFLVIIQILARHMYLPIIVLGTILAGFFTLGSRLLYRAYLTIRSTYCKNESFSRVMVIGAGEAATMAVREMQNKPELKMKPICFIDDRSDKLGTYISGLQVAAKTSGIVEEARKRQIDIILIAIPSMSKERKKFLVEICKTTGCTIKSMPSITEILSGTSIQTIQDIRPEELLSHKEIKPDHKAIREQYFNKVILVTGAAGTVGTEICMLVAEYKPRLIIMLEFNEDALSLLQEKFSLAYSAVSFKGIVLTVKDANTVSNVFRQYKPQIVFHCAFQNRENLADSNPVEVVRNNIYGTLHVAEAALANNTEKFILVSTDKATRPTSLLLATKRISEMIIQSMNQQSGTDFASVRFGNIIEDTSFYIQKFRSQIEQGGPLTLEHREITRYFMTIKDAGYLLLQAGTIAKGGEIFVLDMGAPVKIYDLARDMIRLSGFEPDKDIMIKITGNISENDIREEILNDEEGLNESSHEKIYIGRSMFDNFPLLRQKLSELKPILENGDTGLITFQVLKTVKELIPNFYQPSFEEGIPGLDEADYPYTLGTGGKKRIFLASPHMGGLEKLYVKEAFDTNWIAPLGPNVDEFEREVQRYVDVSAAVAMTTGTAAIHMSLRSIGIVREDIVFCSSLTFSASCNPIIYQGASPVFIDSEPTSWNMSPKALAKAFDDAIAIGRLPKAVIVVNLYGQSADYDKLLEICSSHHVPIIEDAAESIGATYKGKQTGTIGKYGIFSFNGNKIITTSGGGMLISNDEPAIKKVKFTITQARDQARHYQHSELGFNYRMSNVLAGIGRGQLQVLNLRISQKKKIYEYYRDALKDITDIEMMPIAGYGEPNYWLSAITIAENSPVKPLDIILALESENIESRPVWKPMHLQPYYMKYEFYSHNDEGISVSERIFNRGVCLPSDTKMTDSELDDIVKIIKNLWLVRE